MQTIPRITKRLVGSIFRQPRWCRMLSNEIDVNNLTIIHTTNPGEKPDESNIVFGQYMTDHMLTIDWSSGEGWKAPEIVPYGPLTIPPNASVLHYGLEVFEGMKAYRGDDGDVRMFRPMENMKRLVRSSTRLSLPSFNPDGLLKCIEELVKLDQDWIPHNHLCSLYIRPTIISTEATLGVKPPEHATLFVIAGPVGPYFSSAALSPISLLADPRFVRAWPGGIGESKAGGNYGPTIYPQKIAQEKGCDQCLWLYNDEVTEVGTMNIFMYWINENGEEELVTPPLNGLILPGITRKSILESAREWNDFKVSERSFTMHDIIKATSEGRVKEMFGAGTACVVCPINKILYKDEFVEIPTTDKASLAGRFYKELNDIQYGVKDHPWAFKIEIGSEDRKNASSMS
eukprot:gene18105-19914_t